MKKLMKAMSLTLAASLVVASLTACGGGEKTETKAEGGAAAAGEDVFLIGAIGPVTGSAASYGFPQGKSLSFCLGINGCPPFRYSRYYLYL